MNMSSDAVLEELEVFENPGSEVTTFVNLLLNRCWNLFIPKSFQVRDTGILHSHSTTKAHNKEISERDIQIDTEPDDPIDGDEERMFPPPIDFLISTNKFTTES